MSSVHVRLYAVTKVLSQIWGPPSCPEPPAEARGSFPPAVLSLNAE